MKKTGIIVLVIVLVVVISAEIFLFVQLRNRTAAASPSASAVTESPEMVLAPPPTLEPVTPTPAPTQAPATPTPVPTQAPATASPAPTAEPTPTPARSSSGSCSSNTGVGLNMTVDWRTEDLGDGTTRVYLTGKIKSYSLDLGGTSVNVSLGGQSVVCSAPSFFVPDGSEAVSDLFSTSLDVPSGTTAELNVVWNSNCTYSGVFLSTVTATGSVTA